jgi:ribosomal protein L11 methyltransferase
LDYLGFTFSVSPFVPGTDILISELADAGFESFEETAEGCKAWIASGDFDQDRFDAVSIMNNPEYNIRYTVERIPARNWNAEWESGFEPVVVGNCLIRAPFHEPGKGFEPEVIILPQMSFGPGHHETTSLMAGKLLTMDLKEKEVLDMGCGTGVLAILAALRGAALVWAVDNNENAFENTQENIALNGCRGIVVHKGDASILQGIKFHVIFANINRNVLLADMGRFARALLPDGKLLLSGFFETDIPELIGAARQHGLKETDRVLKNEWALLELVKG